MRAKPVMSIFLLLMKEQDNTAVVEKLPVTR